MHSSAKSRGVASAAVVSLVAGLAGLPSAEAAVRPGPPPVGVGSKAAAASTVNWQPCSDPAQAGFQCARVRVPLNYAKPHRRKITLAVVRRPADDPAKRIGSIFFNPGGPGGPGFSSLPQVSRFFAAGLRERFDLVSWDPRGVGQSTAVQCFPNKQAEADFLGSYASVPVTKTQQKQATAHIKKLSRLCGKRNSHGLLKHVSTADSARDLDRLRAAVGDSKLNYLGVSYGTFLGATYANLFPKRVRALTLDGNVNPTAWVDNSSPPLATFLRQKSDEGSQETLNAFLKSCGRVGVDRCAFSAGTAKATRNKYDSLVRQMRQHPNATRGGFTYSHLMDSSVNEIYFMPVWPRWAQTLQSIWLNQAPRAMAKSVIEKYAGVGQQMAIACGESPNPKLDALRDLTKLAEGRSGPTGAYWAWLAPCGAWPAKATSRYAGPWNKRTAKPVLVVGVTTDPATPFQGSVAMSKQLRRARLLTLKGYGHTALLNPSACIDRWETRYFIDGKLPPKGTTCRQNQPPFAPNPGG